MITVLLSYRNSSHRTQSSCEHGWTFFDFESIERCLVLDLDSRYDLIPDMTCLEHHKPWRYRRSLKLGSTRTAPSGPLESDELTSARNQKRY